MIEILVTILYFLLLIKTAKTDLKNNKIYNKDLLMFLFAFVLINIVCYFIIFISKNDKEILKFSYLLKDNIIGFIIGLTTGFVLYILGVFKGGDAKLIAIVGLIAGKDKALMHFAIIIIVAGVGALYVMVKNKILIERLKKIYIYVKSIIITKTFTKYACDEKDGIKFPFAVYVMIGETFAYLYFLKELIWA